MEDLTSNINSKLNVSDLSAKLYLLQVTYKGMTLLTGFAGKLEGFMAYPVSLFIALAKIKI